MPKTYLLFDIVAITTNGKPLLNSSPVLQRFCLLSGLSTATVVPEVNLLNDDPYRCDSAAIIMSSFGQIEQGAH